MYSLFVIKLLAYQTVMDNNDSENQSIISLQYLIFPPLTAKFDCN